MRLPFYPTKPSLTVSVTAVTTSVQIADANIQLDISLRVINSGTKTAFLAFGQEDITATSSSGMPVLSLAPSEILNIPEGTTFMAAICGGTDTTTLIVTPGRGGY